MIVVFLKVGKIVFLKSVVNSIVKNYLNVEFIVFFIDERLEEVIDMKEFIEGDVIYFIFD